MTKRVHRSPLDNMYHVGGKAFKHLVGSRRQVFEGFAVKTSGELSKADLMRNQHGRYVSRSKHASATREMRLKKYGYTARKGKFGAVKMTAVHKSASGGRTPTRGVARSPPRFGVAKTHGRVKSNRRVGGFESVLGLPPPASRAKLLKKAEELQRIADQKAGNEQNIRNGEAQNAQAVIYDI